jgi:hypothetical protein
MLALLFTLTSASAAPGSSAESGDDTLKYFLSKSDLVVFGKITNMMVFTTGTTIYLFDYQIREVMKGDGARKGQSIAVSINRMEDPKWKWNPFLKEGSECILFLRSAKPPAKPPWREADYWFAVQPPSGSMVSSLKRLVTVEQSRTKGFSQ